MQRRFDANLWALKLLAEIMLPAYTRLRDTDPDRPVREFRRMWEGDRGKWEDVRASPLNDHIDHLATGDRFFWRCTSPVDGTVRDVPDDVVYAYFEQEYRRAKGDLFADPG